MNAKEANQIPICSFLDQLGIKPCKISGHYCFYTSPYRMNQTPSFKVDRGKNLWVNYGDGNAGGTLIYLVLKMNPTYGISDAINQISRISGSYFSFHQQNILSNLSEHKENPKIYIYKIKPLGNNPTITDYLQSRGIALNTAKDFCKEIYYSIGDKKYFGLGNENDKGWAIRNRYWKGCTAQGISHFRNRYDHLCLFEGIFDLLSYVEMQKISFQNRTLWYLTPWPI